MFRSKTQNLRKNSKKSDGFILAGFLAGCLREKWWKFVDFWPAKRSRAVPIPNELNVASAFADLCIQCYFSLRCDVCLVSVAERGGNHFRDSPSAPFVFAHAAIGKGN